MASPELFRIATEIWSLIQSKNCVAWMGSGLSRIAGYQGWPETIGRLCSACGIPPLGASEAESADRLIDKAEECKDANSQEYYNTLASLFGGPVASTRHAFSLLMRLPFKGYITTNFDPLLCAAGSTYGYNDLYSYPSLPVGKLEGNTRPIFYIHGLARQGDTARGDNLILARSDFERAYSGIVRSFLDMLLTYYPILFIGCNLAEPDMYEAFGRVREIHAQIRCMWSAADLPQRYLLLPTRRRTFQEANVQEQEELDVNRERSEEDRFRAMDIEVIEYDPIDERHWEVEQILEHLCALADMPVSPIPRHGLGEEAPS